MAQNLFDRFAQALGLSAANVKDALKQVQSEMLDDAIKSGRISSDRADAMRQRIEQGRSVMAMFGRRDGSGPDGRWGHAFAGGGPKIAISAVAKLLDVKPEELMDDLKNGKTLEQIASARNTTAADAVQAVRDAMTDALQTAVKAGRITQAEADARLKSLDVARLLDARVGSRPAAFASAARFN